MDETQQHLIPTTVARYKCAVQVYICGNISQLFTIVACKQIVSRQIHSTTSLPSKLNVFINGREVSILA